MTKRIHIDFADMPLEARLYIAHYPELLGKLDQIVNQVMADIEPEYRRLVKKKRRQGLYVIDGGRSQ